MVPDMLQLIIISLVIISSSITTANDDTPLKEEGDNKCAYSKPLKIEGKKEAYEGRWFAVKAGTTSNHKFHDKCETWDVFFDKKGNFHVFIHLEDSKDTHVFLDDEEVSFLKDAKTEQFLDFASGNLSVVHILHYVDKDLLVVRKEGCTHKVITRRDMIILVRNVADESKHKDQINTFSKEFLTHKGKPFVEVPQKNCKYHKKIEKKDMPQLN